MIDKLIRLADKLDREGKHDLANAVDQIFSTAAGRPKAPLKTMDEKVKKNLIKFIYDADKSMKGAAKGIEELIRRLRYFNLDSHVKEMNLMRVLKDMERMEGMLSVATNRFYEITHGKKPSKDEMDAMFADDGVEQNAEGPLDFFDAHSNFGDFDFDERQEEVDEEEVSDISEEMLREFFESDPTEEDLKEQLDFMKGLGEDEDEEEK